MILLMIFSCLFSLITSLYGVAKAEPYAENNSGYLIIHIQDGLSKAPSLDSFCSKLKEGKYPNGKTFQQMYSWTLLDLSSAYGEAERGLTGQLNGIAGTRNVRIIIYPRSIVDAGVN